MLNPKQVRYLKAEAHHVEALYQVGKNKLGPTQIDLLMNGLKARELIKVRVLKSVDLDFAAFAHELASTLEAELVETKGHIITLFKAKAKESQFKLPQ